MINIMHCRIGICGCLDCEMIYCFVCAMCRVDNPTYHASTGDEIIMKTIIIQGTWFRRCCEVRE